MIINEGRKRKPKLFKGLEVEGELSGVFTLFVQGLVPIEKIKEELGKCKYGQVYFGAGNLSEIDTLTVDQVLRFPWISEDSPWIATVTFETAEVLPAKYYRNPAVNVFINLDECRGEDFFQHLEKFIPAPPSSCIQFKMKKGRILVSWSLSRGNPTYTLPKDYKEDQTLWEGKL